MSLFAQHIGVDEAEAPQINGHYDADSQTWASDDDGASMQYYGTTSTGRGSYYVTSGRWVGTGRRGMQDRSYQTYTTRYYTNNDHDNTYFW